MHVQNDNSIWAVATTQIENEKTLFFQLKN